MLMEVFVPGFYQSPRVTRSRLRFSSDTARRRPDLPLAAPRLGQHVELAVIRQDDVRLLADEQPAVHVDAHPRQFVDFLEERLRIDDDAAADDAGDAGMQDARGDKVEDELRALHVNRVAGVVAALVARHGREVRRQHVDDLPLALVAPLRAQHCDVHGHAMYILIHDRRGPRTTQTRRYGEKYRAPCSPCLRGL